MRRQFTRISTCVYNPVRAYSYVQLGELGRRGENIRPNGHVCRHICRGEGMHYWLRPVRNVYREMYREWHGRVDGVRNKITSKTKVKVSETSNKLRPKLGIHK